MPSKSPLVALVRHLSPDSDAVPDAELVGRYARTQDQAAFELLIWRHGGMVWSVCVRILAHDLAAAEDACQAVFVALASHAGRLREGNALAAWLHRVALRAALDLRSKSRVSPPVSESIEVADTRPGPEDLAAAGEVRAQINAAVNRLPERLRIPFVLCELEGRSNADVAAAMDCPVGTVESRLTRARHKLRGWLSARGITTVVTATAGTAPLSAQAAMVRAGLPRETLPPLILALAQRAARPMLAAKIATLASLAVALVALGTAAVGIGLVANQQREDVAALPPARPGDVPHFRPAFRVPYTGMDAEGVPLPPGAVARLGSSRLRHGGGVSDIRLSPDKTRIVSCGQDKKVSAWDAATGRQLWATELPADPHSLRFTANGERIVVVAGEHRKSPGIWHLDASNGKFLAHQPLELADPGGMCTLFPDGAQVVVESKTNRNTILSLDTRNGAERWKAEIGEVPMRDSVSEDGSALGILCGKNSNGGPSGDQIHFFGPTGKKIGQLTLPAKVKLGLNGLALSRDGRQVVVSWPGESFTDTSYLANFDRETGQAVWLRRADYIEAWPQSFSPDGKGFVLRAMRSSREQGACLMSASDGSERAMFPSLVSPCRARFLDDRLLAIGAMDGPINLVDPQTFQPLKQTADPPDTVYLKRFSADGRTLFVWAQGWLAWDLATGQVTRLAESLGINWLLSPDGSRMARFVGEKEKTCLEIADARTGNLIRVHQNPEFRDTDSLLAFTADGTGVIANLRDGLTTRVWSLESGKEVVRITRGDRGRNSIGWIKVSGDGRFLAEGSHAGSEDPMSIWNLETGREVAQIVPPDRSTGLSISGDGRRVAAAVSAGGDQKLPDPRVTVWDVSTQRVIAQVPQGGKHATTELSPDGRTIAVKAWPQSDPDAKPGLVRLCEVASGSERMAFPHEDFMVGGFLFSPDGRLLAVASGEAPVYLWDLTGDLKGTAPWDPAEAEDTWERLASPDARKGFLAIRRLRANPTPAIAFLKERIRSPIGQESNADRLRLVRVVEAVEGMETVAAYELLEQWSRDPTPATLTAEASAALARIKNRK